MTMEKGVLRRGALLAAAVTALSMTLTAGTVQAGGTVFTGQLTIDPASGPPGSTIQVSGDKCTGDANFITVPVRLLDPADIVLASATTTPGETGDWGPLVLTVPLTVVPGTTLTVTATCDLSNANSSDVQAQQVFSRTYPSKTFIVTQPQTQAPTQPVMQVPTLPRAVPPPLPRAVPPAPLAVSPRFTG